jgi:hypothetical protein
MCLMRVLPFLVLVVVAALAAFSVQTPAERLDASGLKGMLEGLGYELKPLNTEPGKEKWELKVVQSDLEIFIGAELSSSKNYIWLTVFFKPDFTASAAPAASLHRLLKGNASVQPSQFYITDSNNLMMALPVENRSVTPVMLRRAIEKIAADVVATKDIWGVE